MASQWPTDSSDGKHFFMHKLMSHLALALSVFRAQQKFVEALSLIRTLGNRADFPVSEGRTNWHRKLQQSGYHDRFHQGHLGWALES